MLLFMFAIVCMSVSRHYDLGLKSVEGIWLEILITKSTNISFSTLFRPPVGSQFISADFNTRLEDSLSLAIDENKEILLVGNLNADFVPRQRTDGVSKKDKGQFKRFWHVTVNQ